MKTASDKSSDSWFDLLGVWKGDKYKVLSEGVKNNETAIGAFYDITKGWLPELCIWRMMHLGEVCKDIFLGNV